MTRDGAWNDGMPIFLRPVPDGIPPVGDPAFDALLDRTLAPHEAPAGLRPLAEAFAALDPPPAPGQPGAEATALMVFRGALGRRRHLVPASLLSAKFAAAATVAVMAVAGTAAAAFAGKLPGSAQKLAHDTIGAPMTSAPRPTPASAAHRESSTLPGGSAFGLCTAWEHTQASGTNAQKAAALRKLEAAAGGASRVSSFCAAVPRHADSPSAKPSAYPSGRQTPVPWHGPATRPSGVPTPAPSSPAASHAWDEPVPAPTYPTAPHPAGEPTAAP